MTIQELYDSIGGNYENAKRILQMDRLIEKFIVKFLDDQSCQRLLTAWEGRDEQGVFEGAHALKGVCANLGLNNISDEASEIAEEFRPGNSRTMDDAAVEQRLTALKADYERAIAGIRDFQAAK